MLGYLFILGVSFGCTLVMVVAYGFTERVVFGLMVF